MSAENHIPPQPGTGRQELGRRLMNFYTNSFVPDSGVTRHMTNANGPAMSIWSNATHGDPPEQLRMDFVEGVDVDQDGQFHVSVVGWARLHLAITERGDVEPEYDLFTVSTAGDVLTHQHKPHLAVASDRFGRFMMTEEDIAFSRQCEPDVANLIVDQLAAYHEQVTGSAPASLSFTADVVCHSNLDAQTQIIRQ